MYSAESLITMADGSVQHINTIRAGDKILNKLYKPVAVSRLHTVLNATVAEVQLNNGTGVFYTTPTSQVFCHHVHNDGTHVTEYSTIADAYHEGASLKSSVKVYSPESDVSFITFNEAISDTKTVYCLHTLESSRTYLLNGMIACCSTSC